MDQVDESDRRQLRITRLLLYVWLGLGIIVGLVLCYIVYSAFKPVPPAPLFVGDLDQFPPNSINKQFVNADFFDDTSNREIQTLPLQVVRDTNGNFTVFFARSTRPEEAALIPRQCLVDWDDSLQTFLELCAGSQWTREGKYLAGPAPRDLDRFPAHVENGKLYIDLQLEKGVPHS